jgi:anti-sigma regulatory factor (Ser/Thr protein kinase)
MIAELKLQLKNDLCELARASDELHAFLSGREIPPDAVYALDLAFEELVSNIIKYAYDDRDEHVIDAGVRVTDDSLALEIRDDGRAFDPFGSPEPDLSIPACDRPIGGLGIHLVRNLLDRCEYRRSGGSNVVRIEKRVEAA